MEEAEAPGVDLGEDLVDRVGVQDLRLSGEEDHPLLCQAQALDQNQVKYNIKKFIFIFNIFENI